MNQQDSSLNYGLNARRRTSKLSAFQDEEDSDSSPEPDKNSSSQKGGRQVVNKDLSKEQLALRKRAEEQLHSTHTLDSNIFDYDDHYESFSSLHQQQSMLKPDDSLKYNPTEKKESRYISSLLHHAKQRQQEQEIVKERKIAKEQAEEESKDEFQGKDRFITNAFKRKLQEREEWLKNDEELRKREEHDDVTKKKAGETLLFAGFHSNLQQGRTKGTTSTTIDNTDIDKTQFTSHEAPSLKTDHQKISNSSAVNKQDDQRYHEKRVLSTQVSDEHKSLVNFDDIRSQRLIKVLDARKRYLDRLKELAS